jgi:anti-sigma factor RsiW
VKLRPEDAEDPLACREFVELVTDYLDGALPPAERSVFEAHTSDCEGCAAYLHQIRTTAGAVRELRHAGVDVHTRARLLSAFRELRSGG